MSNTKSKVQTLTLGAILTALVIVLQSLATYTTFFGPFSTAIGLIPIVIGAAMCGPFVAAWLGLVFGCTVLITGGAALFLAFTIWGTVITVLVKGAACGLAAGLIFKWIKKYNTYVAVLISAIVCPVVNTGVFLLGCVAFFMEYANSIAATLGWSESGMAVFWALATGNFLFELGLSIVLSPVMVRLLRISKKLR